MSRSGRVGCYPGSFNPPTVAHLAVAEAAVATCGLDRLDLVVSRSALGKAEVSVPSLADRLEVLRSVVAARSSWLGLVVSSDQLLVDLARGYDVLVVGADKWAQVLDVSFYGGSVDRRDAAVSSLPPLAIAPRGGTVPPGLPSTAVVLGVAEEVGHVSSTAVRVDGRVEWMAPEAAAFDARTGAWTDPGRYSSSSSSSSSSASS